MSLVSRTALTFLAGLVAVPMTPVTHTSPNAPAAADVRVAYESSHKEAYLTSDQLAYVRPGIVYKINSVTIGADRKVVADVTITDSLGAPVDRLGVVTPGVVSASFVLGWYNPATRDYTTYATRVATAGAGSTTPPGTTTNQATSSAGTFTDLEMGHFKFNITAALPAGYDATKTHTLAVYGRRTMPAEVLDGKVYIDNTEFDFRPDGQAVTVKWDEIQERNSCNQCHDPISAHGDVRQDLKLCVLCHSPQTIDPDTGNSVDMRIMVHKIHRGPNLPSVLAGKPYVIIGNQQSVHDYSEVTYPQDIRNCANCHEGRDPANKPSQSDVWYTKPARNPCGACHDDLDWVTGANHAGGPQADDSACASCHQPQGSVEWDAGIKTAHTVPLESAQLKGYKASIISVTNAGPGQKPVVTFKLQNGDNTPIDPGIYKVTTNGQVNIILGGPTSDYTNDGEAANGQPFRENASGATYNATTGTAVYNFTNAIPAAAKGTYTFSIETRRPYTLNPAPKQGPATVNEGAPNVPFNVAVTGTLTARRTVVSLAKCNTCHDRLDILFSHGNQRIAIEHCVICHNPNGTDLGRRPADGSANPGESIEFARMIHRIHTGLELEQDYTIYGFGGAPASFNEVTYPGDRRNCLACHVNAASYALPLPIKNQPVTTPRDYYSPMSSDAAACTGCHDSRDALAHTYLNTAYFPNNPTVPVGSCGTCHGTGADLDVAKVHAR